MKKRGHVFLVILTFLTLAVIFAGCNATESLSDDSTKEAEIERGLNALDSSNFTKAEEIFKKLTQKYPSDKTLAAYYSNALSGQAGLDTFKLMKTIDEMDQSNTKGDTIQLVGRTLTNTATTSDPVMTSQQTTEKKALFEKANDAILTNIISKSYDQLVQGKTTQNRKILSNAVSAADLSKLNYDERVQLGLIAINHAILVISQIVSDDASLDQLTFTKLKFKETYNMNAPLDANDYSALLKQLSLDIELTEISIEAIETYLNEKDNDIAEEFKIFKSEIDNGNVNPGEEDNDASDGTADDNIITLKELEHYLENL